MPKPILNIADVEFRKVGHGSNFPRRGESAGEIFRAGRRHRPADRRAEARLQPDRGAARQARLAVP
jgi:hypothetical protein